MYDGSVAVYNLQKKTDAPIFKSTAKSKHADPVWQVSSVAFDFSVHQDQCGNVSLYHIILVILGRMAER